MRNAWILASCALLTPCARAEVTAAHGMVVTTTGTGAAAAGVDTLRKGGNAMDAAMTAVLLQPCLAAGSYVSYAGIINVVYFDAASGKVFNLNGGFNTVLDETEPLTIPGINPATLAAAKFESFDSAPSGRTALVPGFFAGVEAAQRRFGKRRFSDVVAPAIRCADQGFVLSPELAGVMKMRETVLRRLPETRAIFTKNGALYVAGETFHQPALAATLRAAVKQGVTPYLYRGEWARAFVEAVRRDGGKMTRADLEAYQPTWIEPVHTSFNGFDVYAHGLPSVGGVNLIQSLNLATAAHLLTQPPYRESPLTFFWQLQFAKVGNFLAAPGVAPQFEKALGFDLAPPARLKPETAVKLWKLLEAGQMPSIPGPRTTQTAHSDAVVAVDAAGNLAAVVHTINTVNWGSTGIFVGGISIPDSAAFQQPAIAALTPGSRLPDLTNPGVALKDGKPALTFSSIGAGVDVRTLGALLDVLGHGMTPEQAIASPAHGGFDYSKAASGEIGAMVGVGEFSAEYLEQLRKLGQPVREDNAQRGYWIGIGVGTGKSRLRGGELREMNMGGGAVGY
jgi:gamma-glutamyltranspeptidase/glutathione hydrolase